MCCYLIQYDVVYSSSEFTVKHKSNILYLIKPSVGKTGTLDNRKNNTRLT